MIVSAPMGPTGLLCIQRTLNKGRKHGLITGLGAALSDVIYAVIACLGMGIVATFLETNETPLKLIGSLVLAIFGLYTYQNNSARCLRKPEAKKLSFTEDFFSAFFLTFSNVLIVLLYISLFVRFGFIPTDYPLWITIDGILCIGIGAVLWWYGITYFIEKLRKWFNIRGIWLLNRIVGAIITFLAIAEFLSVLINNYIN
ncbi:MAG: LysE family transporter [Tannerellaceae bacterium]|nr:LysE family transporter [Tannerellaceae bacterium]